MTQEERSNIIDQLEIMRGHGQFDEQPEEKMDFTLLSDEELAYYNDEWIAGQFDE